MAGRPKLPSAIKELQGTTDARWSNPKEPVYKGKPVLVLPDDMDEVKRARLEKLFKKMSNLGVVQKSDEDAFTLLSVQYDAFNNAHMDRIEVENLEPPEFEEEADELKFKAWLYEERRKARRHEQQEAETMLKFMREFGMTPSSRSKVSMVVNEEIDPMEELIS